MVCMCASGRVCVSRAPYHKNAVQMTVKGFGFHVSRWMSKYQTYMEKNSMHFCIFQLFDIVHKVCIEEKYLSNENKHIRFQCTPGCFRWFSWLRGRGESEYIFTSKWRALCNGDSI